MKYLRCQRIRRAVPLLLPGAAGARRESGQGGDHAGHDLGALGREVVLFQRVREDVEQPRRVDAPVWWLHGLHTGPGERIPWPGVSILNCVTRTGVT
jgi:hypothetical protein